MINKSMERKLLNKECMDVAHCKRNAAGDFILDEFIKGIEYCDSEREFWIGSIGRCLETGQILASTSTKFYQNPEYECLFLR